MKYYFPELDYWFRKYWEERGEISVSYVNLPETVSESFISSNSVFELLFSEVYDYTIAIAGMKNISVTQLPKKVIERLSVKRNRPHCYITDATFGSASAINVLNLEPDTIAMLGRLWLYKSGLGQDEDYHGFKFDELQSEDFLKSVCPVCHGEGTIIINNEGNTTTCQTCTGSGYVTQEIPEGWTVIQNPIEITSKLAKLIYYYLNMKINGEYNIINNIKLMEPFNSFLEHMYALYVINECHKYLKVDEVIIESAPYRLRPIRQRLIVTQEIVDEGQIVLDDPIPETLIELYIYHNGTRWTTSMFNAQYTDPQSPGTSPCIITWNDTVQMDVGDRIILDYYSRTSIDPSTDIVSIVDSYEDYKKPYQEKNE